MMKFPLTTCAIVAISISLSVSMATAQDGLPTLEEAIALSQKTGRPILAMAGQKT